MKTFRKVVKDNMNEEKTGLNYASLWKTLMRTGIKQRFSLIRSEFFMKLATDGVRKFKGEEAIEDIIADSEIFKNSPSLAEYFKSRNQLDDIGGIEYLGELGLDTVLTSNIEYYAQIIKENAIKREKNKKLKDYYDKFIFISKLVIIPLVLLPILLVVIYTPLFLLIPFPPRSIVPSLQVRQSEDVAEAATPLPAFVFLISLIFLTFHYRP